MHWNLKQTLIRIMCFPTPLSLDSVFVITHQKKIAQTLVSIDLKLIEKKTILYTNNKIQFRPQKNFTTRLTRAGRSNKIEVYAIERWKHQLMVHKYM